MQSRRTFLKTFCGAAASVALPSFAQAALKNRPNILFILVDDLGWADLGCYGSTFHESPNLDKLAASAMRFTDAYAACPVCSPTRAAIMTGRYPTRLNITDWIPGMVAKNPKLSCPEDFDELPLKETTLSEVFQRKGYATFFAGKWHLGKKGYFPEDQGFDINKGGHHKGSPPGGYYTPYKNPKLEDGPEGEYLSDRLTTESIQFMEAHHKEPFLLYLSFYTVHTPIQACKRHLKKFQDKVEALPGQKGEAFIPEHDGLTRQRQDRPDYASMVYAMDENIGRLLNKLDELKLRDNTIIVFTSDNGGLSTVRGKNAPTANLPLRAGKGWCYEGGIRVPLIIRAPGVTQPASTSNEPVISMDCFPTLLDLAGLRKSPKLHRDGHSLVPLLRGKATLKRKALFWHYPHYHGSTWTPGAAVRAGDWKLITFYDKKRVELYNLKNDIGERKDLAKTHPKKRKELQELLQQWQKETGAKMPEPNPDYVS
jgi:arylsulfatase A-like enzyme